MTAQVSAVSGLYGDLHAAVKTAEWDKVLTISNKVLQESAEEQKAFQCKTAALIHLGKFEDCLHHLKPGKSKFGVEQRFERAYCEYRLNRLTEALASLEGCESARDQELRAQILYRLERYGQALSLYRSLVRSCADDYGDEREANMAAACAAKAMFEGPDGSAGGAADDVAEIRALARDTYDQMYNAACALIGRGRLAEAAELLGEAERACRSALADEDPDGMLEELAPIQFQQAYLAQVSGSQQQEWRKTYQAIANAKLADAGLLAVCANNLVCANRDQNLFDSKKRIKLASGDAMKQKLTRKQRQAIAINQCLVYLHSNQGDLCKRAAEALLKSDPDLEAAALIVAAQLSRERPGGAGASVSYQQAADFLDGVCAQRPDFVQSRLAQAQLLALAGAARPACDALKQLPAGLLFSDRLVAAVVRLYVGVEDRDAAAGFLADARGHFAAREDGEGRLRALLKLSARFQQASGNHRQAACLYSELLQLTPNDQRLIASLVHAYAQFDPPKAEETSRLLKESPLSSSAVTTANADLDADQLESSFAFGSKYSAGKQQKGAAAAGVSPKNAKDANASDAASKQQQDEQKKRKRRPGKLPKNHDPAGPPPDPERWLPRRERSHFRGKKKDKHRQMTRGPQGATAAAGDLDVRARQLAATADEAAASSAAAATAASDAVAANAAAAAAAASAAATKSKQPPAQGQQKQKKKPSGRRW